MIFCAQLNASMAELVERATPLRPGEQLLASTEWYSDARANWEEIWQ